MTRRSHAVLYARTSRETHRYISALASERGETLNDFILEAVWRRVREVDPPDHWFGDEIERLDQRVTVLEGTQTK